MINRYLVLGALLLWAYWSWQDNRSIAHAPGVLAPAAPTQTPIEAGSAFMHQGYALTPRADFSVHARVLGREHYYFDRGADLSPTDLALGWGPMSDSAVLDRLDIGQHSRYYFWSADELPIPRDRIVNHSSNMHLIPASEDIADAIDDVIAGDLVNFKGKLVDASSSDGWRWASSLSRSDTGNGACELVYVERFEITGPR